MKRHRATTSCPGTGPPRDDRPCDGVERFCWQPDFYRIAILLLWVERYHSELLLPGLRDEIRVVCGRGRNPTLSPPGVTVFRFGSRGPSVPARATGPAGRRTGRASPA